MAHCRMTHMGLEHMMSECAAVCPRSYNDHLVFPRKQVVCILSVVIRMVLKPSPTLPLFHYGLCIFKSEFTLFLWQLPTILFQSVSILVPWDTAVGWDFWVISRSVACCSVAVVAKSISLSLGSSSVCRTDKAFEEMATLRCVATVFFSRFKLNAVCSASASAL